MHYNYFRDYDPGIGRYIQSDPIGLDGGLSTFGYVAASPLIHFDPFGLACQFMGTFPVATGTEFDFASGRTVMFTFRAPTGRGTKPDCALEDMAPRPRRLPTFPPKKPLCQPEIIWEQWDFVKNWFRQLSRDYTIVEDIFICDPKGCNDSGIIREHRKEYTGSWSIDFERRTYDFERRSK